MVDEDEGPESVEDHRVDAFDHGTRISVMSDGSVTLKVPQMPPSWRTQRAFDGFQAELAEALGVQVEGLDKELFRIPRPTDDTVARLKTFLLERRRRDELK